MVGILGPTSAGKAAALLGAPDPAAALARHEQGYTSGCAAGGVSALARIPTELGAEFEANQALMERLGSQATPTIFFKDGSGLLQRVQGAWRRRTGADVRAEPRSRRRLTRRAGERLHPAAAAGCSD